MQLTANVFHTPIGRLAVWNYRAFKSKLEEKKWQELIDIAIELITFFLQTFIVQGKVIAPKWWKIPFWAKVGKTAFRAVRRIIELVKSK